MTHCANVYLLIVLACLLILSCARGSIIFDSSDEKLIVVNPFDIYEDKDLPGAVCNDSNCFTDFEIDSCICSDEKHCLCTRLEDAFSHVEDNTVIAINGTIQEFITGNVLYNVTNISVIGYHEIITINCHARGSIEFKDCNNVIVENITWISCGSNDDRRLLSATFNGDGSTTASYGRNFLSGFSQTYFYGLYLKFCTNVTLRSCAFEASMIGIYEASGIVCIDHVYFLSTDAYDQPGVFPLATGLIINQTNVQTGTHVEVKVINSHFSQTNCLMLCNNLLLFYILFDDPSSTIQVFVNHTSFSSASYDPGWAAENGMVWMRILSSMDAYIEFNEVKFLSNNFKPELLSVPSLIPYNFTAILHIASDIFKTSRHGHSTRVKIESCTFLNNYANKIALFEGDLYLDVTNTQFYNSIAESVLIVTYTFWDSYVPTTVKLEQSIFSNNTGGQLMLLTGVNILVNISGLQITSNILSSDNDALILFKDYDNIIADISNVKYELNHIVGEGSGFRFTSTNINPVHSVALRFVTRVLVCFPSDFQDVLPNLVQHTGSNFRLANCTEMNFHWFSITNSSFNSNIGGGHGAVLYFNYVNDGLINGTINTCTFNSNIDYRSLVYASSEGSVDVDLIIQDSIFTQNEEILLYVVNHTLKFCNEITVTVFDGNRAQNGPVMYLDMNSKVIFANTSAVSFSNNIARRYGGAIYCDITQSSNACYRNVSTLTVENNASVVFNNNQARAAGNSIFFSISQSCNSTLKYDEQNFVFGQSTEVVMSPNLLRLYHPAQLVNNTDLNNYYINDIMLGQEIIIPACTLDLNEMPLWSTQFTLQLIRTSDQNYSFQGNDIISVDCRTLQGINNLIVTGSPPPKDIISIVTIQLNSFYDSAFDWKPITVNLNVQLSSCHLGFYYSSDVEHCVCYTTDNIVTCSGSNSTIRNGYWFGTVDDQPTVTICPINYCNFDNCEATTGTCDLHPLRDNQCRAHRSGAACGNCEEGYTLSFDSIDCIDIDSCTVGHTVLVITMSFLYWIAFTAAVFSMMYFKIGLGYLYGIIFYYSIIDIVLGNILAYANSLYQLVATLSSIAKLLPQFLGQLCFVKGMSGIDQQFIHYLHPLGVLLILALISVSTRYSSKLSMFLSRAVIHAFCLLLLLTYSSIASTCLLLVRAISFTSVDKVYSYLSPDIEYFHGRHLFYGLIAIITGLVITIGLPLLLLLQPFINSKANFIKIKPLLDQFQGCYKDKFRYFASYYMVFRFMILGILAINETNALITLYSLQVICIIMILVHVTVRPYNKNIVNIFDSLMLATLVLVISLQIAETSQGFLSNTALGIAFVLVILPLFVFLLIVVYLNVQNIKILFLCCKAIIKSCVNTETITDNITEMPICVHETSNEIGITIDENVRRNAIIVGIDESEEHLPDIIWCREPFFEELNEIEALNDIRN